ncbi:MAG: FmdE family protein [Deltaproteobacteria bacterium]|nr:FmdE family protein [Deltaproteobacteria bacterium]
MQKDWQRCVEFHGHACPGLAIGFRACEAAKQAMDIHFSQDEELVCVTENDACGVDAVQVLTGCTFGKGNLIYRDVGKMAFTFFERHSGKGVRVVFKGAVPEGMDRNKWQGHILTAPIPELFQVTEPRCELPPKARIVKSVECACCNERTMEHKTRLHDGKPYCSDCFEGALKK